MTMTVVQSIIEQANRLYWDDLRAGRWGNAINGAAKLVMIETGITPTDSDKKQAEEVLRKGVYTHRHRSSVEESEYQTERTGNPDEQQH